MASVFLREWQRGDAVTATDLQELVDAVAALENSRLASTGSSQAAGGVQQESDGPVEWPWQVLATTAEAGHELYVVPGRVLTGGEPEWTDENGTVRGGFKYTALAGNVVKVSGFDATLADPQVVYLQLWGEVVVRRLTMAECYPDTETDAESGAMLTPGQYTELKNARLEVVCVPAASSLLEQTGLLRVWPLAVYTPGHEQPVTQLQWGLLSAVECRGLVDSWGAIVWPTDRSGAADWGKDEHGADMATLTEADFSTARETITGPLMGCIDTDGAVEFYLGVHEAPPYVGPLPPVDPNDPTLEEEEDDEEEDTDDSGGGGDGGDGGDDDEGTNPDEKIAVKIGYEAGDGFRSCALVRRAGGYYWKLELDPDFVRGAMQGLSVPATMTLAAGGSQVGVQATVEMGLGTTAASAGGTAATGTAQLVFHGTNAVDASTKTRTEQFNYSISLDLEVPGRTWYLSPRQLSTAGSWVKLVRSNGASNFNVRASEWWTWHVDREKFRQAGINQMKIELANRTLSATDSSTSADSTVTGALSGTAVAIHAAATLS